MPSLGEAYIEVHADTGPFDRELAASIEKALIAAEATMRSRGRDAGNAFGEGVEVAIEDHVSRIGDTMADQLEDAAREAGRRASIAIRDELSDLDLDLDLSAQLEASLGPISIPEFDDAVLRDREDEARGFGVRLREAIGSGLGNIGATISSALSGFSQLGTRAIMFNPAVLLGAFGAIGGLIAGLSGLITPILALLSAIPAAIGGLGLQAVVIAAAFSGIANSIGKIFGAESLGEALTIASRFEGGTRLFLEGLAHLSQVWRDIVAVVEPAFFAPFGTSLETLAKVLSSGQMLANIRDLAASLGRFGAALVRTFASGTFERLLGALLPAITRVTDKLTGPFLKFLDGLFRLMEASLPFLEDLADSLATFYSKTGEWMAQISRDGTLSSFYKDAQEMLSLLGQVFDKTVEFVAVLVNAMRETQSDEFFLQSIIDALKFLNSYFSSDTGKQALADMVTFLGGLIMTIALAIAMFAQLFSWFMRIIEGIVWLGQKVAEFFGWLGRTIGGFFTNLSTGWTAVTSAISGGMSRLASIVTTVWNAAVRGVTGGINSLLSLARGLGSRITSAVGNLDNLLYNAGWNVIQGFIRGLRAAIPDLRGTLGWITSLIPANKGPESVDRKLLFNAGFQVMQGFRHGMAVGAQGMLGDLAALTGLISMTANANSFVFTPGSIVQNFNGAQPSVSAATGLGSAVGSGIVNTVNNGNMAASTRAI